jgi:hypothetical protein
VHRRRYSALEAASGRAGKPDFGRRSVEDHDARRIRVVVSMVASWASWKVGVSGDIFRALRVSAMARRWQGDMVKKETHIFGIEVYLSSCDFWWHILREIKGDFFFEGLEIA